MLFRSSPALPLSGEGEKHRLPRARFPPAKGGQGGLDRGVTKPSAPQRAADGWEGEFDGGFTFGDGFGAAVVVHQPELGEAR